MDTPRVPPPLTPFTVDLNASIKNAIAAIDPGDRGQASVGVSLTGVEATVAWRPLTRLTFGGSAERLWGGTWKAGVKGQVRW